MEHHRKRDRCTEREKKREEGSSAFCKSRIKARGTGKRHRGKPDWTGGRTKEELFSGSDRWHQEKHYDLRWRLYHPENRYKTEQGGGRSSVFSVGNAETPSFDNFGFFAALASFSLQFCVIHGYQSCFSRITSHLPLWRVHCFILSALSV